MLERIAVIADVHGNIPALEAVLKDIAQRGVKRIICLGDTIGKGPNPDIAVDKVRQECEVVIQGNWEAGIIWPLEGISPEFAQIIQWNLNKLGTARLDYLAQTPYCIDLLLSGKLVRLFHSSAKGIHHRVHPVNPLEERLAMFENTVHTGKSFTDRAPDVVGYADIHGAYIQHFEGKTLFNTGSVGNPLDITQSSYVIIEGTADTADLSSLAISFVRVPYDIESAILLAENEPDMPGLAEYISELRTAKYARKKIST